MKFSFKKKEEVFHGYINPQLDELIFAEAQVIQFSRTV
jgi:hypothetical protein